MKVRLLKSLHQLNPPISINRLIKWTGQSLLLPFYHTIQGSKSLPHIKHLYPVRSTKKFIADIDFLLKHYQPISLHDLLESVKNNQPLPPKSFLLSFDDGLREVYDIAFPILQEKGVPATIFLNSDFVDNKALFFRYKASYLVDYFKQSPPKGTLLKKINELLGNQKSISDSMLAIHYQNKAILDQIAILAEVDWSDFLKKQKPYLTTTQIQTMIQAGHSFGGHSMDHPFYANLSLEEQITQTRDSINFVQKNFSVPYKVFAFPFSDDGVGKDFFHRITTEKIADLTFGCAGLKTPEFPFHFQRIPLEIFTASAAQQVKTEYLYFLIKSIFGKNKIRRS